MIRAAIRKVSHPSTFATLAALCLAFAGLRPAPASADEKREKPVAEKRDDGAKRKHGGKKSKGGKKKLEPDEAAYIIVQASFSDVDVTINGKPYPVTSKIGAVVAPNKLYEVVVKDQRSNTTARYKVRLRPREARLIVASLGAGGPAPKQPSRRTRPVEREKSKAKQQKKEEKGSGYLTVNATPTAQVYIDGKLVASKTPLVKHKVEPGNHTVRVYYVQDKKFSETKRAMITDGRHVNLYFQNQK